MKRIALAAALAAAACGPKRTTAASQPSPAAFDASGSDPKAIAAVDAMATALGGYDKWASLKELRFEVKFTSKGQVQSWLRHSWDRWDGRHRFQLADPPTLAAGDPAKIAWLDVRYDMFDDDKLPFGTYAGQSIAEADARRYAAIGKKSLMEDAYLLTMFYKLRDPGVHLGLGDDLKDLADAADLCKPSCTTVKVTFEPAVGKDTWFVELNADSHLPQLIMKQVDGGKIGYRIDAWSDAGGLKWPTKLSNVAIPDEVITFDAVAVGEPKDDDYEAPIDRSQSQSTGNHESTSAGGQPTPYTTGTNTPAGSGGGRK